MDRYWIGHWASQWNISFGMDYYQTTYDVFLSFFNQVVNSHHVDFANMAGIKYNPFHLKR